MIIFLTISVTTHALTSIGCASRKHLNMQYCPDIFNFVIMSRRGIHAPFKPPRKVPNSTATSSEIKGDEKHGEKTSSLRSCEFEDKKLPPCIKRQKTKVAVPDSDAKSTDSKRNGLSGSYVVQWRKKTAKKNKTWEGDGILMIDEHGSTFQLDQGKDGKTKKFSGSYAIKLDGLISIGVYELAIDYKLEVNNSQNHNTGKAITQDKPPPLFTKICKKRSLKNTVRLKEKSRLPLYDPGAKDALVLPRPPDASHGIVDVVLDPLICKLLRPHQKEAVKFLYSCIMGFGNSFGSGALLADEMGLGKTLSTIALIWTLLKQNPYAEEGSPICKKVLIACPVTLIGNWLKEFKKWLDLNRIGVLALNNKQNSAKDKNDLEGFAKTKIYQVLIMSYEKVLSFQNELLRVSFDLLVCDEGHRLKNSSNKTLRALNELDISRKIILTGTPIQNDLGEYYNIINFINPNILGTYSSFQRKFMGPILRARDANCLDSQMRIIGEEKSNELISLTKEFILRRTCDILSGYMPPRTDVVLFCPPTLLQKNIFSLILQSPETHSFIDSESYSNVLSLITLFKKISNSPSLIIKDKMFSQLSLSCDINAQDLESTSGKIKLLIPLLIEIRKRKEKIVLVSNYTQSLDLLVSIISKLNFSFLRLDGNTPSSSRESIVTSFNKQSFEASSIFLLSSKAGGVGLNLIGASRLILFDNDWNPSVDIQAMARIHRYGQQRPVFIYRLITTGSIDEKIFQRQIMKSNLSDKFLGDSNDSKLNLFKMGDLKDLFTIFEHTRCNTHDLLECSCPGDGTSTDPFSEEEQTSEKEAFESNEGWISALDYLQRDRTTCETKKNFRHALIGYKHFDPCNKASRCQLGDSVLENIMKNFEDKISELPMSYMFIKTSLQ